jgi:Leucine-rich repeat (LRR) protein
MLQNNLLSNFGSSSIFSSLSNLISLDLSQNQFTFLEAGIFFAMTLLESLYISSNKLTQLPIFGSLSQLNLLNLSNDYVDDFSPKALAASLFLTSFAPTQEIAWHSFYLGTISGPIKDFLTLDISKNPGIE